MTKVTDKKILQLGIKASTGNMEDIMILHNHIHDTYGVQTTEPEPEPEPEPPQEAV